MQSLRIVNTKKANQKPIESHIAEESQKIIDKYKNKDNSLDNYVFPILEKGLDPIEIQRRIKNFTRTINQNIKKLAKELGLPEGISCYWARHSYVSISVIKFGYPLEYISKQIHDGNINTTKTYLARFDDNTKKALSYKLMDFN